MRQEEIDKSLVASLLTKKIIIVEDDIFETKFVFYLGTMMTYNTALYVFSHKFGVYFPDSVKQSISEEVIHLMRCGAFGKYSEKWLEILTERLHGDLFNNVVSYYVNLIINKEKQHEITLSNADPECLKLLITNIGCAKQ